MTGSHLEELDHYEAFTSGDVVLRLSAGLLLMVAYKGEMHLVEISFGAQKHRYEP